MRDISSLQKINEIAFKTRVRETKFKQLAAGFFRQFIHERQCNVALDRQFVFTFDLIGKALVIQQLAER